MAELEPLASSLLTAAIAFRAGRANLTALLCACHRRPEVSSALAPWDGTEQHVVESVNGTACAAEADPNDSSRERPPDRVCCAVRAFIALSRTIDGDSSVSRAQLLVHPAVVQRKNVLEQLQDAPLNIGLAQYLCALFPDAPCSDISAWWAFALLNPQIMLVEQIRNAPDSDELGYGDFVQSSSARRWSPLDSARAASSRPTSARSHSSRPSSAGTNRRSNTARSHDAAWIAEVHGRSPNPARQRGCSEPPVYKVTPRANGAIVETIVPYLEPVPPSLAREGRPRRARPSSAVPAVGRPTSAAPSPYKDVVAASHPTSRPSSAVAAVGRPASIGLSPESAGSGRPVSCEREVAGSTAGASQQAAATKAYSARQAKKPAVRRRGSGGCVPRGLPPRPILAAAPRSPALLAAGLA